MHARFLAAAALLAQAGFAQPTVAPTPEQAGPTRGDNLGDYNILNSFETGYRFRTFGGSFDQYRSTVNYGDGIRLLSSFLTVNSKDGHGKYFDEIVLTTQGLGNDPYESATLRIQKNKLYRYDMGWRLNDYFNPGLRTDGSNGRHLLDTEYTTQDHDLTLFPQSNFKFFLGYTHGNQNGPALSSVQLFDSRGNEFPLFENVRRVRNEYRIGNEIVLFGFRFTWMRGWEDFKEDTDYSSGMSRGDNPNSTTSLTSFHRNEPYHGTSPYWRAGLFTEKKYFALNGRFTYSSGRRGFILDETAIGSGRFGIAADRQTVTSGIAQRPITTGNLTLSLFPTAKLTITNHTAVTNLRIDGDSVFAQFDNASQTVSYTAFEFLGIRTVANETQVNLQASPRLGLYAGYDYSNRLIRSIELSNVGGNIFKSAAEQTNQLNSGVFGVRFRPVKPLSISLQGEIGRADRPLSPIADRNYHLLGARVQYKVKKFQFSAAARSNYNTNSVALSSFASHARTYSADASWTPRDWFGLDAGYTKLHLNTLGGLSYFASGQQVQGQSLFISNIHAANLTARFDLRKRADVFVGYSHTQDTGDDRPNFLICEGTCGDRIALLNASCFPLSFRSPMARFSLRLTNQIRWNVGYQYYGYNERFYNGLDYRAHTGYSSVLWAF